MHEILNSINRDHDSQMWEIIKNNIDLHPDEWTKIMKPHADALEEHYSNMYPSFAKRYGNQRPELLSKQFKPQGNIGLDIQAQKYE